ncbi:MAG: glycosyltransferase [Ignavibacteria bacterium]|nr:glycosyltransferase [Ignavibacteria bacterium]
MRKLHKTAFVLFNQGAFGGAIKRYALLFLHLSKKYNNQFHLIVNSSLFSQIFSVFPELEQENILIIPDENENTQNQLDRTPALVREPVFINDHIENPEDEDKNISFIRKTYRYYKNYFRQKKLFKKIERYRKQNDIKVFIGIYAGILPLVFYMKDNKKRAAVIFSDMDSWFSEIHKDMKKMWYRKYYSFNYALENSDIVDFLSPYILQGVKDRNVKLKEDRVHIAPCSFADYQRCYIGDKSEFLVAFAARIEPDKNPFLFLEAACELSGKYENIKFIMMGDGTLVNEVRKFITQNHLEQNVKFFFSYNPPEILSRTSVFVTLQSSTNYPSQSVLEAMACGNVIISSDTGDSSLFIKPEFGILINLNKGELVSAIEKLLKQTEETHKMGHAARKYVLENHTMEKYSDYMFNIIDKAYNDKFLK